jgi:outer membrane protein assembly factor BamD (BamD/ComL family)
MVFHPARPFLVFVGMLMTMGLLAQGNITYDLTKPKAYENRKLASELTPDKKINPVKRLKENIVSHYNFHFNASLKLSRVLSSAKQANKDTFTALIPFYNYSLDQTAQQQQELDSVVIKVNNGILLHDLRNDWVDDLYLLMGQSYFYQKKFDSAYDVFQYINYNFQPRSKDEIGFEKSIGSNINENGSIFNIASKENKFSPHRLVRNDALLWIIRTQLEMGNEDDASGMIETLYHDNLFPKRLTEKLAELKAYLFYRKQQSDSAATYLEKSLGACEDNAEQSRRLFLIAQLYARSNQNKKADDFFEKAVALTTDPIMEAYARIYQIGLSSNQSDQEQRIDQNVKALINMANKEKYANYRSIIYAAAAEMELKRKNIPNAIELLLKSNQFNTTDTDVRNNANLNIASLAFSTKQYALAKKYYDSINIDNQKDAEEITRKKNIANALYDELSIVDAEDSLQALAALPEKEREAELKIRLKKLRKERGLSDDNEKQTGGATPRNTLLDDNTASLFPAEQKKGEWYFNNPTLKAQGSIAFKNKWGNRANGDNWRRAAALNAAMRSNLPKQPGVEGKGIDTITTTELSIESLREGLPLTAEKLSASNERKYRAYQQLGSIYKDRLEDCKESINWNEKLINQKANIPSLEKLLFDLAYCYRQTGNNSKASFYQAQLAENFPASEMNKMLRDPLSISKAKNEKSKAVTQDYDKVYNLFLSGKFELALAEKRKADSLHGENNWSPQLLYIEAVYYIKNKQDSLAIDALNKIPSLYPNSPLAMKAGLLADALNRREIIENELRNIAVTRQAEDSIKWIDDSPLPKAKETKVRTEPAQRQVVQAPVIAKTKTDTTAFKAPVIEKKADGYTYNPTEQYGVLLLLKDVDVVYINEAKRALTRYNAERYAGSQLTLRNDKIGDSPYILISVFANAVEALGYVEKTAPIASKEIFPWLPAEKYSFVIISPDNLKKVLEEKVTGPYLQFIRGQIPGKF